VKAAPPFLHRWHWDKVLTVLQAQVDARGEIDWRLSVDSTIARVHQHGATAARSTGAPMWHHRIGCRKSG
jgi:hypothetical protein